MKKYLSHRAAINYWDAPYVSEMFGNEIRSSPEKEFTVFNAQDFSYNKESNTHLCSAFVPQSMKCEGGAFGVVSPELAYLQVARQLNMHQLILLGILLCGRPIRRDQKRSCSKQKMLWRIQATKYHPAKIKALRALKYVEDSCRSPMEAILFMLLRLPHALGGYSLSGACFDFEVMLNESNSRMIGKASCFADIYYSSAKLFVEYDSKEFHSSQQNLASDSHRTAAIIKQGYQILSIRTEQLYCPEKFDVFARNVASYLNQRIRIRSKDYQQMKQQLRELLPRFES